MRRERDGWAESSSNNVALRALQFATVRGRRSQSQMRRIRDAALLCACSGKGLHLRREPMVFWCSAPRRPRVSVLVYEDRQSRTSPASDAAPHLHRRVAQGSNLLSCISGCGCAVLRHRWRRRRIFRGGCRSRDRVSPRNGVFARQREIPVHGSPRESRH